MTGDNSPIRILVLHTEKEIRGYLVNILRASRRLPNVEVDEINGSRLDHKTALDLLKKNYDYIYLNTSLPFALSLRIAELVHLAKVQTRLVLVTGCGLAAELLTPLFDVIIAVPCGDGEMDSAISSASALGGFARTALPTEVHVEAALKGLIPFFGESLYSPGVHIRSLEDYRLYFPHPEPSIIKDFSPNASLARRLSAFAVRTPADDHPWLAQADLPSSPACRGKDADAMKETYYTREDFLNWYLDALQLVPDQEKWNEELWRENPPRFYRFLRLYALAQGLGIECPLRDVAEGKFIKMPLGNYQSACAKIWSLYAGCDTPVKLHAEDMGLFKAEFAFSQFLGLRVALEKVLRFNSGMLECGTGVTMYTFLGIDRMTTELAPHAKPIDEILCEFLAPHNPRLNEEFLLKEFGFPVVSIPDFDSDWI